MREAQARLTDFIESLVNHGVQLGKIEGALAWVNEQALARETSEPSDLDMGLRIHIRSYSFHVADLLLGEDP